MPFADRADAGRQLAARLTPQLDADVVVGLPRGGVPVAAEVADALGVPLDVIVVRKLGLPRRPELAMGAVGEGGVVVVNEEVMRLSGIDDATFTEVVQRERAELDRRVRQFRGDRPKVPLTGRAVVVVDDGLATGATARAACAVARAQGAARVVLAVPVASPRAAQDIRPDVDDFYCVESPAGFSAVGQAYGDFRPTRDEEVVDLLRRSPAPRPDAGPGDPRVRDEEVEVDAGAVRLAGHLTVPGRATGLVVFVHGSGSSRRSPRNLLVAEVLQRAGLGTLLFDLLTEEEEARRASVFDIELLAGRLAEVTSWLRAQPGAGVLPLGYFGASTGAAAALWTAAGADDVSAVVSRGGRPDLAGSRLAEVRAPTLLIVGSRDEQVLALNREALARLRGQHQLAVVPGATHLFEEPGTLEAAAALARDWFLTHQTRAAPPAAGGGGPT